MPTRKLSENLIAATIVPRRARWFKPSAGSVWAKANDCVNALQDLARKVDLSCSQVEENSEISVSAVARRRAELSEQALKGLVNFQAFETAEKALNANIEALERLSERDPEQVQMLQMAKQALADLREGIEATKRLLQERCKLRDIRAA